MSQLLTKHGRVNVRVPTTKHAQYMALSGRKVKLKGVNADDGFAPATVTAADAPPANTPKPMRIAVVLLHTKGAKTEPVTKTATQNSFFGATNSVKNWYESTSDNQVSVSGSVFGYYDSSYAPTACSNTGDVLGRFLTEAATDAARDGYKAADYDHIVVYTPRISICGFSGTAWVGANGVLLNGTISASTAEHELGHNLGLWHAGSCAGANVTSSCVSDYGDMTDVMGASTANHGFNAEHKRMIGWLPQSEIATVTAGTHTIALTSSTHPLQPGTTEEIVIPRGDGTSYFVERRTSEGYDNGLDNVYVRVITRVNTDDTIIFDPVPSSPSAGLGPGETYVDSAKHITIATLSNNAADPTASVKVCIGSCGGIPPTTATTDDDGSQADDHDHERAARHRRGNRHRRQGPRARDRYERQ